MHTVQGVKKGLKVKPHRFRGMAHMFFAAADPARIEILLYLARENEACVSDIAGTLSMSIAAVSHHLQILRECRCLKTARTGQMICYKFLPNDFTRFVVESIKKGRGL